MMRYVFIISLVAIVLGILAGIIPHPATNISFDGRVINSDNPSLGIGNAHVFLELKHLYSTVTTSSGEFAFNLPRSANNEMGWLYAYAKSFGFSNHIRIIIRDNMAMRHIRLIPVKAPPKIVGTAHNVLPIMKHIVLNRNQVSSFSFMYTFEPPGPRFWSYANGLWTERSAEGSDQFKVSDTTAIVDNNHGVIVTNLGNPNVQVFIPDKGSSLMWVRFRYNNGQWAYLAKMKNVQ